MTRFYIVVSTNEEMKTEATRLLHKTASESKILNGEKQEQYHAENFHIPNYYCFCNRADFQRR